MADSKTLVDQAVDIFQADAVAWALNVGGGELETADGIRFLADEFTGGVTGTIGTVSGVADSQVFRSYRAGPLSLEKAMTNGFYDLTFLFAEPDGSDVGQRVFDVLVNDRTVLESIDLSLIRGSSVPSALVRTVPGVELSQGKLTLELRGRRSVPVLSGIVVRKRAIESARWQLVWSDEFDYQGPPDPQKWHIQRWPAGKVNDEDQAYTDRPDNVRVNSGKLILQAHREHFGDAQFTSGRVHSQGLGDFLYGRVDIRARLPAGQGTWSALWMLPSDPYRYATNCDLNEDWQGNASCDAWPNSGEIDIMEHVGFDMPLIHGTVHNNSFSGGGPDQHSAAIKVDDVADQFHVYSLQWSPDRIRLFVDGIVYYTYLNSGEGWQSWPYDHPYHLIMNLAVGGSWGRAGGPIDESIFPVTMEIDYVRVFEGLSSE